MARELTIGPATLLEEAPTVVTADGDRYVLGRTEDGEPVVFSAVCPHQRGRVGVVDDSLLRCPNHRWEFDPATGACLSGGDTPLTAYETRVADGEILAVV